MRRWMVIAFLSGALLLPSSAQATPDPWSPISPDDSTWIIGQHITIEMDVDWSSRRDARAAVDGSTIYYSYLITANYRDQGYGSYLQAVQEERSVKVPLAQLTVSERDTRTTATSVTFQVPEVPPDTYLLAYCTFDCQAGMGATSIAWVKVYSSPEHARIAARANALERRVSSLDRRNRKEQKKLEGELDGKQQLLESMVVRLERAHMQLVAEIRHLPPPTLEERSPAPLIATGIALGFCGAFFLSWLFPSMRSRKHL